MIRAHLRNCEYATEEAHDLEDERTISIRHAGADRADLEDDETLDELAVYLAEYLGTYGDDDPLEEPEHVQAANAVLWSTNRQRWRPCQTAQQYMKHDPADSEPEESGRDGWVLPEADEEWRLVGIENGDEFYPCDDVGGGVETFTTTMPAD